MPDHDNGCGAAVAEITASTELAKDFTLFQIEESLVLLAEWAEEEGLTPEIERALTVYLEGAAEKRDRVADFIHFCEGMAELAKAEGKRLQARQKHFEATAERVSDRSAIASRNLTGVVREKPRPAGRRRGFAR